VNDKVVLGDCLAVMKDLPDDCVDSVVCDPPYGLEFMGKDWDHGVPGVEFWIEALRVAKPGAYLLAFGGTRMYHRLACAIEDAGWEIRDSISWLYGSGFPKSLDIGKALDKTSGRIGVSTEALKRKLIELFDASGKSRGQIDDECGFRACNYLTLPGKDKRPDPWINVLPSQEKWVVIKRVLRCTADLEIEETLDRFFAEAEREVLGSVTKARSVGQGSALPAMGADTEYKTWDITAPATDAARQWNGWGTALKPAWEPIIVARKPLIGTVAANVLKHGTGGINIDGCRIETSENLNGGAYKSKAEIEDNEEDSYQCIDPNCPDAATMPYHDHPAEKRKGRHDGAENWRYKHGGAGGFEQPKGRWPANVALDEEAARLLDEQSDTTKGTGGNTSGKNALGQDSGWNSHENRPTPIARHNDSGGASRFFYTAKASRAERTMRGAVDNKHPTVKPVSLMRWLVRMVTPPQGSVLDPFCGSGSTLVAAELEGFDYLGIEQDPESHKTACERLANAEVLRKKTDPKTTQVATDEEP
jgi:DNA modification methylase